MSFRNDCWIVDAVRSPTGKRNGSFSGYHPAELGAIVLNGLLERTKLDTSMIPVDDVFIGCVSQVGAQSSNIARGVVLSSKLPISVPATTVDRQCGSSLQALILGYNQIKSGTSNCVIAGGVEIMSAVPLGSSYDLAAVNPKIDPALRHPVGTPLPKQVFDNFPMCKTNALAPLQVDKEHTHPYSITLESTDSKHSSSSTSTSSSTAKDTWYNTKFLTADTNTSTGGCAVSGQTCPTEAYLRANGFQQPTHSQFIGADLIARKYGLCLCSLIEYARLSFHRASQSTSQSLQCQGIIPVPVQVKSSTNTNNGGVLLPKVKLQYPIPKRILFHSGITGSKDITAQDIYDLSLTSTHNNIAHILSQSNNTDHTSTTNHTVSFIHSDETLRPVPTFEKLLEMCTNKPIPPTSWITAPLASQISDGASMALLTNTRTLQRLMRASSTNNGTSATALPLGRILAVSSVAGDPTCMLDQVAMSIIEALIMANRKLKREFKQQEKYNKKHNISSTHTFQPLTTNNPAIYYEINEAFASVPLVAAKLLRIQPHQMNRHGGAIALGHPLGATGTKLIASACRIASQYGYKYAVVSVCEGGGMANAVVIEVMPTKQPSLL